MKRTIITAIACICFAVVCLAQTPLHFDATGGRESSLLMPDGTTVEYVAYEKQYYVTHIEDSAYQYLNIYVPHGADEASPIFLRTYVGGYMAAAATEPQAGDATGRALREGYVVVIPGTRGRNSVVGDTYTGRAPKAILDLKAAIRFLRFFDAVIPGDAERIITDGTSAGGAMSALMGATGNHPDYETMLEQMGAAPTRDDVFASVCYCPIIDLDHADMAYEWLYSETDSRRSLDATHRSYSEQLAAQFGSYIDGLNLLKPDGSRLDSGNYLDYLKHEIMRAAQIAKNAGADIPDSIGFSFSNAAGGMFAAPLNGQAPGSGPKFRKMPPKRHGGPGGMGGSQQGEYVIDLDMTKYLNYVVSTQALKTVPAFDSMIEDVNEASGENEEFGDTRGSKVNFTDYTAAVNGTFVDEITRHNVKLMNPMNYIDDDAATTAPHWYIRHGARDRDTAFPIPINFAVKLSNAGKDVNFLLAWNRPHSGDYALDELFEWIASIAHRSF